MALYVLFISLALVMTSSAQTGPNFCSYSDGIFYCDYASMVSPSDRPIDYSGFSEEPQQLEVTVNGFLPTFGDDRVFSSGFAGIDETQFDPNYPATLTLDCGVGGSVYMTAGAFSNMSHVQHLKRILKPTPFYEETDTSVSKHAFSTWDDIDNRLFEPQKFTGLQFSFLDFMIRNCVTFYVPSTMFIDFDSLDYFSFEGGEIDDVDPNAMFGSSVEKLTFDSHSIPRNLGRFEVKYSAFKDKSLPPGLLFNWKNLSTVAVVGADLETITADVFTFNTKLTHIDISDNLFTSIPDGIFDNLNSLSEVTIRNIEWGCTCDSTWFVNYADTNNITLLGDYMCSNIAGTSVKKYWHENCVEDNLCEGTIGFVLLKKCLTLFAMLAYGFAFVSLVLCVVCLILICLAKKQALQMRARRTKAKGRWNRVMDVGLKMKMKK